jgi:hypothetical protein
MGRCIAGFPREARKYGRFLAQLGTTPLTVSRDGDTIDRCISKSWGEISDIETFAVGSGIGEIARLRRVYGRGRWRKRKGIARVKLADGTIQLAELHSYEASGIGRKEYKIKRLL